MTTCRFLVASGFGCLVVLAVVGCGGSLHPQTYPVTGTVVYRGQPVEDAEVTFMPSGGRIATGKTDTEGRFHMCTFGSADGVLPGQSTVLVVKKTKVASAKPSSSPYDTLRNVLPERYGNPTRSGLTATVEPGGKNDFRFELKD